MSRVRTSMSLRMVALAVVVSSVLLGAGWIAASSRHQEARAGIEALRAREALANAERAVLARLTDLRAREDARPFYLYSHYYVPPDLLTLTDAIAVSPLAEASPPLPVIGWFQVDPDGTVRTPLTPEPSATPTGLEARLRAIALSPALAAARAGIADRRAGGLAAHVKPLAGASTPTRPRARVARRAAQEVAAPAEAPLPSAPLPVLLNQQANLLANDIQRAQAGDPESYERAAQSTQAAFVAQVVERPPAATRARVPRSASRATSSAAPPSEATPLASPPVLPAVTATIDVQHEPMRWLDAGDTVVLARVVASRVGTAPDEALAVLQGVALDRPALLAWMSEAAEGASTPERRVRLAASGDGCALSSRSEQLPPGVALCLRERWSPAFAADQQAAMHTDLALVAVLVLFVLLALLTLGRVARREAELSAQRSEFVTAMSHELRTPLTTLRMHAEMLEQGMVTPERMTKVLAELSRETARLGRLVDNVLEASRLEAGRRELHPAHGDLHEAAARIVDEHRAAAEARGMTLVLESSGPVHAWFDEAAVERILANLIENAIKYADGSADPSIVVSASGTASGAELAVRDHGPGVDPAERLRVFERFHRVTRQRDAHRPGTGLGLALVRELARAHGGDARFEDVDDGARVVVQLPTPSTA